MPPGSMSTSGRPVDAHASSAVRATDQRRQRRVHDEAADLVELARTPRFVRGNDEQGLKPLLEGAILRFKAGAERYHCTRDFSGLYDG